jgi:2-polyprenyl-3-methyl-5-hydroxy-6-metoxy-1,4-benzoquinol methylase
MKMNHSADLTRVSALKQNSLPGRSRANNRISGVRISLCERDKRSTFQHKSRTLAFYNKNARQFCASTQRLNLRKLYSAFLHELPSTAHILDAGCGSGRDTKAFLAKGHKVKAIDASHQLALMATKFTGQHCQTVSFQNMDFHHEFDGIWACASLLHISHAEMPVVLRRFANALKHDGVLFVSLKEGHGEHISEDGRFFSHYTPTDFAALLTGEGLFRTLRAWKTNTPDSSGQITGWLNFLARTTS